MNRSILGRLVSIVAGIFICSGMGMAAEFSADMIQTGENIHNKGRLYVKGDKIRQEINAGYKQIVIERPDKDLVWTIDPVEKTYMKVTDAIIRGIDDPRARERLKSLSTSKQPTKETINGYLCTKRQWVTKKKPARTLTEWTSDKLKFILKIVISQPYNERVIEYKNIKLEPVPDSLFELPKGYQQVIPPAMPVSQ